MNTRSSTTHSATDNMDSKLSAAYRQAEYCIWLDGRLHAFQIGAPADEALSHLQQQAGLRDTAFIVTPCNPGSHRLSMAVNRTRLASFRKLLRDEQARWLPAVNRDPKGEWPDEPGALLLDCSEDFALEIARAFGQLAIVRLQSGQPTEMLPVD